VRVNGAEIRMQMKPQGTGAGIYAVSAMIVSAAVEPQIGEIRAGIERCLGWDSCLIC